MKTTPVAINWGLHDSRLAPQSAREEAATEPIMKQAGVSLVSEYPRTGSALGQWRLTQTTHSGRAGPFVDIYYTKRCQNRQEPGDDLRKEVADRSSSTTHLNKKAGERK